MQNTSVITADLTKQDIWCLKQAIMFYNKTCTICNTMRSRLIYSAHARPAIWAVHCSAACPLKTVQGE